MIYGLLSLLGLGLLLCILVAPFVALARTGQLRRDVDRLYREMLMLRASFDAATTAEPRAAPPEPEPAVEPEPAPAPDEPFGARQFIGGGLIVAAALIDVLAQPSEADAERA